ncbi:hypothetical protein J1614_002921 [Plenodomus biglobosus]|nr:hypothetical protein J1614_002921 [Plenodomus biglobosus]
MSSGTSHSERTISPNRWRPTRRPKKKEFVYSVDSNTTRIIRLDDNKNNMDGPEISRGCRFVDVESQISQSSGSRSDIQIATVTIPATVMVGRLLGNYKKLYVDQRGTGVKSAIVERRAS